jgi:hypothetical protein
LHEAAQRSAKGLVFSGEEVRTGGGFEHGG